MVALVQGRTEPAHTRGTRYALHYNLYYYIARRALQMGVLNTYLSLYTGTVLFTAEGGGGVVTLCACSRTKLEAFSAWCDCPAAELFDLLSHLLESPFA